MPGQQKFAPMHHRLAYRAILRRLSISAVVDLRGRPGRPGEGCLCPVISQHIQPMPWVRFSVIACSVSAVAPCYAIGQVAGDEAQVPIDPAEQLLPRSRAGHFKRSGPAVASLPRRLALRIVPTAHFFVLKKGLQPSRSHGEHARRFAPMTAAASNRGLAPQPDREAPWNTATQSPSPRRPAPARSGAVVAWPAPAKCRPARC